MRFITCHTALATINKKKKFTYNLYHKLIVKKLDYRFLNLTSFPLLFWLFIWTKVKLACHLHNIWLLFSITISRVIVYMHSKHHYENVIDAIRKFHNISPILFDSSHVVKVKKFIKSEILRVEKKPEPRVHQLLTSKQYRNIYRCDISFNYKKISTHSLLHFRYKNKYILLLLKYNISIVSAINFQRHEVKKNQW